jgi:hypothetical protein
LKQVQEMLYKELHTTERLKSWRNLVESPAGVPPPAAHVTLLNRNRPQSPHKSLSG